MTDVYTHQESEDKFIYFGSSYGYINIVHRGSGVLRVITEDELNWNYICYIEDDLTNPINSLYYMEFWTQSKHINPITTGI